MLQLNNLQPLVKKRKRVGRGGKLGGTSGKGHKGQKARSGGYVRPGFEGGQMPLFRRLPRSGFNNTLFKKVYSLVNLEDLDKHFTDGQEITLDALVQSGLVKLSKSGAVRGGKSASKIRVKILGRGLLAKKLVVSAHACSASALEAIKNNGGEVRLIQES